MEAKEPIVVEVKRRNSTTTVNNAQHSDENNQQKAQRACQDEKQIYQPPSSISREVQTEIDTANNCLRCVDYYGYNTSKSDENLIFPDFEYEVMIRKYRFSSFAFKIIMVRILQRKEKINWDGIIDLVHFYYFDHSTFFSLSEKVFCLSIE